MSRLGIQIVIGLIALAIVSFLLWKAKTQSSLDNRALDDQEIEKDEIRTMSRWLEAFVGYYEHGGMNEFLDAVRVGEGDAAIDNVYGALERVGAGAIVPPLKRAADACARFHEKVDDLDHENEAETVGMAEGEYLRVSRQSDIEIRGLDISVHDLLHEFRAKNIEIFQ